MPGTERTTPSFLLELADLLIDPISQELLLSPRIWGQHTFSTSTLNSLPNLMDNYGRVYKSHPFTRNKFYMGNIKQLPKNYLIDVMLLIYRYCKKNNIEDHDAKYLICYFVKLVLIEQKKFTLNKSNAYSYVNSRFLKSQLNDILFLKIIELIGITDEVIKLLQQEEPGKLKQHMPLPKDLYLNEILFLVIRSNNIFLANAILNYQFNIDIKIIDKKGKTALFWACYHKQYNIAKLLSNLGSQLLILPDHKKLFYYLNDLCRALEVFYDITHEAYTINPKNNFNNSVLFKYNSSSIPTMNNQKSSNNINNTNLYRWHVVVYHKGKLLKFNNI